jgi:hypothetical protein
MVRSINLRRGQFDVESKLSAACSKPIRISCLASQASDVGSIPIARSINLVDSVALTPGNNLKFSLETGVAFQRCSKIRPIVPKLGAQRIFT